MGSSLRYWRDQAQLPLSELASRAGLDIEEVDAIERGEKDADEATLDLLAHCIGIGPERLRNTTLEPPDDPMALRETIRQEQFELAGRVAALEAQRPTKYESIRTARDDQDLPLSDLAYRTGLDVELLDSIERGRAVPTQAQLDRIAQGLGGIDLDAATLGPTLVPTPRVDLATLKAEIIEALQETIRQEHSALAGRVATLETQLGRLDLLGTEPDQESDTTHSTTRSNTSPPTASISRRHAAPLSITPHSPRTHPR